MALRRILAELALLLCLTVVSELGRLVARRRGATPSVVKGFLVCSLVLGWYSSSITLVLFNKWVMRSWHGGLHFPVFYTMTHMMLKGVLAFSFTRFLRCRPLPKVRRKVFLGASLIGITTGLDVALSNKSFLFISVTFFTMLKSASLVFILLLGAAVGLERCSLEIALAVTVICVGVFVSSYGEAEFSTMGFCLVIASEAFAAVRWLVTQAMMRGRKLDSVTVVLLMSPASTMSLLPFALGSELGELEDAFDSLGKLGSYALIVLLPGCFAFVLLLIEVQLVQETSSLTLSVLGNLKSIVTVVLAIIVFGEEASALQWFGLAVALTGMLGYSYIRNTAMSVDALAHIGYARLSQDELSEDDDEEIPRADDQRGKLPLPKEQASAAALEWATPEPPSGIETTAIGEASHEDVGNQGTAQEADETLIQKERGEEEEEARKIQEGGKVDGSEQTDAEEATKCTSRFAMMATVVAAARPVAAAPPASFVGRSSSPPRPSTDAVLTETSQSQSLQSGGPVYVVAECSDVAANVISAASTRIVSAADPASATTENAVTTTGPLTAFATEHPQAEVLGVPS